MKNRAETVRDAARDNRGDEDQNAKVHRGHEDDQYSGHSACDVLGCITAGIIWNKQSSSA